MNQEVKIVYIAPNGLAHFVRQVPGQSKWEIVTQDKDKAPRRCRFTGCEKEFATYDQALDCIHMAIANKRSQGSMYYHWEVLVNGVPVNWDDYYKYKRGDLLLPAPTATFTEMTLGQIEFRIHEHVHGACENLLAVGRLLNEAKDGGLVPHGQWADWVRQHTGFNARTAQRLMQTARSVPEGSRLERLPISQVQAILALPDPEEQNHMADRVEEENLTLRQLQEEIRKIKNQNEVLADQNRDLLRDKQEAIEKLQDQQRTYEAASMEELRVAAEALAQEKLGAVLSEQGERFGQEIDALRDRLRQAEEEADQQAESAQALREKLLQMESAQGREEKAESSWTANRLNDCIQRFLSEVSALPYLPDIASWPRAQREAVLNSAVDQLTDWITRMFGLLSGESVSADGEVR
ncbi:MAG: DUF3102 domain-containing protein [Clostridia bacterium]|nr:DUF3102 domain-containing protein [Clostridia bacterium]